MARKAVKGYAEKNYYDNTKFTGGIVATNDPLNEGSFKHLVNFDIADTGQSLTPRKGFLTTALKYKQDGVDVEVALSDKTIYYFDANIGKWIFIDFTVFDSKNLVPNMFKVEFDVNNKYISNVEKITNFSTHNLNIPPWNNSKAPLVSNILPKTYPIYTNYAQSAIDEYSTTQYLIKVKYGDNSICWFTFTYRENESEYEGIKYPADTLVLSCLNTTDVVDTVNTANRNLASAESIIPNPMQMVYEYGKEPLGFVQKFPMIYIKQGNKYLINTTQSVDGTKIIPNFYLREPDPEINTFTYTDPNGEEVIANKYTWAYAYDIISTSLDSSFLEDKKIFRSSIYSLEGDLLLGYDISTPFYSLYNGVLGTIQEGKYSLPFNSLISTYGTTIHNIFNTWTYPQYENYLSDLSILGNTLDAPKFNKDYTLVIYVVPRGDIENTSTNSAESFHTIKLPSTMMPIDNKIDALRTCWYANGSYEFENGTLKNIPSLTLNYVSKSGKKLTDYDELKDFDFSKDNYFTSDQAWRVYNELCGNYSIIVGNNNVSIKNELSNAISKINAYIRTHKYIDTAELINIFKETESDMTNYWFYAKRLSDVNVDYNDSEYIISNNVGYDSIMQTALLSDIISFTTKGMTIKELESYLKKQYSVHKILLVPKNYGSRIQIPTMPDYTLSITNKRMLEVSKLLPGVLKNNDLYYVYFNKVDVIGRYAFNTPFKSNEYRYDSILNLFSLIGYKESTCLVEDNLTFLPNIDYKWADGIEVPIVDLDNTTVNIFDEGMTANLNSNNNLYMYLKYLNYFEQGLYVNMYMLQLPHREYIKQIYPDFNSYTRDYFINTTSLVQSRQITLDSHIPSTYVEYLTEEPTLIKNSKEYFIFNSSLGDHLVTYNENKIFISKESMQYYFPATGYSFSYPETIVKAIQYKDMILVFTTQNLYAVYLTEYVTTVQNGTDDQGNPKYVQQSTYEFATLPVLYNLMVDERYKDAIQVYNQMILFYSADGQMFLIKPTAAIDSNTRFSIQYFNKSVNDILLNYKDYMQERLNVYKIDKVITDVKIKVSTSINFIKIFYTAPGIMTYILIYDIINNRYYVYDTLLFSNIVGLHFIPEGELYVIEDKNKIYFTLPYTQPNEPDNNVDIASYDNFSRNAIKSEIDTGVINLNNHLKKRFKDLHVIYKNLNATDLEFSLDTFIDDVPIITYLDSSLEIRNVSSHNTIVSEDYYNTLNLLSKNINSFSSADYNATKFVVHNTVDFLEDNTVLFNFTDYTSNKVITHRSNIVSKGKAIRTKMYFTSKGKYKIQGYGLVYKEHTV